MKRVDMLRAKVRALTPDHEVHQNWRALWNRDGVFRNVSYELWLQEEVDVSEREPGLFQEDDVPRVPEIQLLAGRQIVAKVLAEEVKKISDQARAELEPQLDTEEAVAAKLPDGSRIGKVLRSKASASVKVADPAVLLAFVKEVYPDEILVTESVNPAFLNVLIAQVKHGSDIPGLEETQGSASYRPTPTDEGKAIVLKRLAGLLAGGILSIGGEE